MTRTLWVSKTSGSQLHGALPPPSHRRKLITSSRAVRAALKAKRATGRYHERDRSVIREKYIAMWIGFTVFYWGVFHMVPDYSPSIAFDETSFPNSTLLLVPMLAH